jgi:hypothetical protein
MHMMYESSAIINAARQRHQYLFDSRCSSLPITALLVYSS